MLCRGMHGCVIHLIADCFFFFKQKTAYEMRISDWSSDVCSSDLRSGPGSIRLVGRSMSLPGEFGGKSFLLASAAIGLSAGMTATLFYSLGSFIPSLQAEFGWSRGDISLAVTLMTLAVFVSGASAGRLFGRYGAANVGRTEEQKAE